MTKYILIDPIQRNSLKIKQRIADFVEILLDDSSKFPIFPRVILQTKCNYLAKGKHVKIVAT